MESTLVGMSYMRSSKKIRTIERTSEYELVEILYEERSYIAKIFLGNEMGIHLRALREGTYGTCLSHPNILKCVNVEVSNTNVSLIFNEYVTSTIEDIQKDLEGFISSMISALSFLERESLIHGQISLSNIFRMGSTWVLGNLDLAGPTRFIDVCDAPEKKTSAEFTSAVDSYALGLIFRQLSPENSQLRFISNAMTHEEPHLRVTCLDIERKMNSIPLMGTVTVPEKITFRDYLFRNEIRKWVQFLCHVSFHFHEKEIESLALTIIDRYVIIEGPTQLNDLLEVGCGAILLSGKLHFQTIAPSLLSRLTKGYVSSKKIISMEVHIITTFNWSLKAKDPFK